MIPALASAGRVVGIDVGGTGTQAVVIESGEVVASRQLPPGNLLVDWGLADSLVSLVEEVTPDSVGIGLPGASDDTRAGAVGSQLSMQCGAPVWAATDLTTAWLGSFLGAAGIVVAAGTGSFAVGGSSLDELRRAGGHGFLLGDEGSAYWLGRAALMASLADRDGSGPPTALASVIELATGESLIELVRRVHRAPADRSVLAGLAPLVTAAAGPPTRLAAGAAGPDPVAWQIVEEAAGALAALVHSLERTLGPLPVVGIGGVLDGPLREHLARRLRLQQPAAEPAVGAALLTVMGRAHWAGGSVTLGNPVPNVPVGERAH